LQEFLIILDVPTVYDLMTALFFPVLPLLILILLMLKLGRINVVEVSMLIYLLDKIMRLESQSI
jgi:hypothetical protein